MMNLVIFVSQVLKPLIVYLGFYVAFNTVQVTSRRVVGRAEETSTYSSLGFCTVNCRPTASNVETIEHLYYFCSVVQDLWSKLAQKVKQHLDITPQLKLNNVLLGCLDCNNKICLNHIFNIVKRYIYSTKCNERVQYIEHLMKIIKQQYFIEKELVKMINVI